jgi:ketosteroid isomerase-like protein
MGDNPIAVAKAFWDAWNARDMERLEMLADPTVELRPLRTQLEGTPYMGTEGLRRLAAEADGDWADLTVVVERAEARGGRVAQLTRLRGRGRVSGVDLDVPVGWQVEVRGHRVAYLRAYSNPDEAFAAVGIG